MLRWVLVLVMVAACGSAESQAENRGKGGAPGSGGATDAGSENQDAGTSEVAGDQGQAGALAPRCVPGASQLCYCASPTRTGAQVCTDDGTRWEQCICGEGSAGSGAGGAGTGGSPSCLSGRELCDEVCVPIAEFASDAENCGRCGNVCSASISGPSACIDGQCRCMSGYNLCNGSTCVDLTSDPDDCGTCGWECASGQCSDGSCVGDSGACGGDLVGAWSVVSSNLVVSGTVNMKVVGLVCETSTITAAQLQVSGTFTANADGSYTDNTIATGVTVMEMPVECLSLSGTTIQCIRVGRGMGGLGYESVQCVDNEETGGCTCEATVNQTGGLGVVTPVVMSTGNYTTAGTALTIGDHAYPCLVSGESLTVTPPSLNTGTVEGGILFQRQ